MNRADLEVLPQKGTAWVIAYDELAARDAPETVSRPPESL